MRTITISSDFTDSPGARLISEGPFSGQEFRERFLEPLFTSQSDNEPVSIILDGVEGYATSFLEEAFGGLARKYGKEKVRSRLEFVSLEDPLLIDEVLGYINDSGK
jgi:hypothetical protein